MDNIYATPQSQLEEGLTSALDENFFVVSKRKLLIMFVGTFGLYGYYWFYKNWKNQQIANREAILPIWRTIFQIFFIHSLFSRIEKTLIEKNFVSSWSSATYATLYLLIIIVNAVVDGLANAGIGSPWSDLVYFPLLFAEYWVLLNVQPLINTICGDASGSRNDRLSPANIIWLCIGFGLWALTLFVLYVTFIDDPYGISL